MGTNGDKALAQLVRDYQAACEKLVGLEHAVEKQAEAISSVMEDILKSPNSVRADTNGFSVPILVVGETRLVPFSELSIKTLHDDLAALAKARDRHEHMSGSMRRANLGNLVHSD